jgi:hypothetical protein
MNGLDEIVRASLRAQVQHPPAMDAPTAHAVSGARALRRRRAVAGLCGTVAVLTLAVAGFAVLRQPSEGARPPVATPAAVPNRPDLLTSPAGPDGGWQRLLTGDGRTIALDGVDGAIDTAYRSTEGWLMVARAGERTSLWLVRPDGSAHRLIEKLDGAPAIAPEGRRFAWRLGDRLFVGRLDGNTVTVTASTRVPDHAWPVEYTGTAVVLGETATGGGFERHDVWLPDNGAYVPAWDKAAHVVSVLATELDGELLGAVKAPQRSARPCLAQLDPIRNLGTGRYACGAEPVAGAEGVVSPDGRWLATFGSADGPTKVALFDLRSVFDDPRATATWDADALIGWLDATTLAFDAGSGALVTVRADRPSPAPAPVTGLPSGPVQPVQPIRSITR